MHFGAFWPWAWDEVRNGGGASTKNGNTAGEDRSVDLETGSFIWSDSRVVGGFRPKLILVRMLGITERSHRSERCWQPILVMHLTFTRKCKLLFGYSPPSVGSWANFAGTSQPDATTQYQQQDEINWGMRINGYLSTPGAVPGVASTDEQQTEDNRRQVIKVYDEAWVTSEGTEEDIRLRRQ